MDYNRVLQDRIGQLHEEGRYRVFADLKRHCGSYPQADHFPQASQASMADRAR